MPSRFSAFFLCLAALSFLCGTLPAHAHAAAKATPYAYTRIFYYQDGPRARQSLFAHYHSIDVLAPQTYSFNATGTLLGTVKPDILDFAKAHKIKVMPLVTNSNFGQSAYKAILESTTTQDAAIAALVDEAKKNGYWGWQIDFEQMDASSRDNFSTFITHTADAMKQNGLILSVAVIAQVSENPTDYPNDLWQKTIGVYDYAALSANTDFISLMSYDDPTSNGPVVGFSWLKQVLAYSTKTIPHDKLSLGIPFYYWQWNNTTGKRIGIGGREGIANVFQKHYVTMHYSAKEEAPYLTYWSHGKQYTIWYENGQSVKKKLAVIKDYRLHGFSAWALGLEVASVYSVLK